MRSENKPLHGQEQSIKIQIPRFGVLFFKGKPRAKRRTKAEIEAAKKAAEAKKGKTSKAVAKTGARAVRATGTRAVAKTGEKAVAKTGTRAVVKPAEKAPAVRPDGEK